MTKEHWQIMFGGTLLMLFGFFMSIAVITALDLVGAVDIIAWHCN